MRRPVTPGILNLKRFISCCLAILLICIATALKAQQPSTLPASRAACQLNVNTFPYDEGFENSVGGWFSGGQSADWAWGIPSKSVISAAGEGSKCWIIGGLTGSAYNGNELSWLQSPCFNLSTLVHPEISFKVFWESERKYDGAAFEYSTDGGNTWTQLGTLNSNSNCQGTNWYNTGSINYLGNAPGWSGNIQATSGNCLGGGGSNGWLPARHSLETLAGQTNVSFRFTFGSGTTCNGFQGFAIDAVHIGEAPPNNSDFTYTCATNRLVTFYRTANCALTSSWNFGDPASGINNTATSASPAHTFSAPGSYTVTLITTFAGGPAATKTSIINILGAGITVNSDVKCFGAATGSLSATATGSNMPYTYTWNTSPVQHTTTINSLSAGTYTVTVDVSDACPASASATLAEPPALQVTAAITDAMCNNNNGSIASTVTGGVVPYAYVWNNGASTAAISNLAAGTYSLNVQDANGCSFNSNNLPVKAITRTLPVTLGRDTAICPGEQLTLSPGLFMHYQWQDNSTNATYTVTQTGDYTVMVTGSEGCMGTASIHVTVDCSDIYFPSGFTPNGDGRNDRFGPGGNLAAIESYDLSVYNRYGRRIFYTTSPFKKWDGTFNGAFYNTGSFTWMAHYKLNGKGYFKKGTLTLIR